MIGSCNYIWFDRRSEMRIFEKAARSVNSEQALYIIIFGGGRGNGERGLNYSL